jgi:hypothetical protein
MAEPRKVLDLLSREELLHLAERHGIAVADRRVKAPLVDALAHAAPGRAALLGALSRDGAEQMLFDRVIANPPFSLDEWGRETEEADPYGRFRFGGPPENESMLRGLEDLKESFAHALLSGEIRVTPDPEPTRRLPGKEQRR